MASVHQLADIHGPRLTGSPNARAAARWAAERMRSWGLQHVHLEPWRFGHPGWTNIKAEGEVLQPYASRLDFRVEAWSPGTHGPISAPVTLIEPPTTTAAELESYLVERRHSVRGRIVLVGLRSNVDEDLSPEISLDPAFIAHLEAGTAVPPASPPAAGPRLTRDEWSRRIDSFLLENRALARMDDAHSPYGMIRAYDNPTREAKEAPPTIVLGHEDFSRIVRSMGKDRQPKVRLDIRNRFNPDGVTSYNTVGEIEGSKKPKELVVVGAHLDSWHAGTGAADDAIGCAIVMEALRLLQVNHLHPLRTVRVILWTGEEQYLLGSQAYVADHFGTAEAPKSDFSKVDAYVNLDSGTGRILGANIFGPAAAGDYLRRLLQPYISLGVIGAIPHSVRRLGPTDATTFSRAGLPSIGLIQDPLDYPNTRHSNFDTVDRIREDQARQAAIVVAGLLFQLANEPLPVPRFKSSEMPEPEGAPPRALVVSHDVPR